MKEKSRGQKAALVPVVNAASSLSSLRSLGRHGIHTIAVSEHRTIPGFWSRYCDETVVVSSPEENLTEYKDALLSLARRSDVYTIMPMREVDVYTLSKYRSEFAEHVTPLWPTFDTLRVAHDRMHLVEAAESAGVAVPETQLLDEVDDWDRQLIVKGRYAALADEYVASMSPEEYVGGGSTSYLQPGVEPDRVAIQAEMGHVPLVQEYVSGMEHAFWALYDSGEPVATCQRNRVRGYKYAGGTSVYRQTVNIPELAAAGRALLDHLDWHGLASVQFIRDANTGEFTLMEINPRFWLSLPLALRAGVDFPYYYWCVAGGERLTVDPDYEVGVGTHLLRGEAVYLHSILQEDFAYVERPSFPPALWEVLRSIYEQPHFDYLSLDDPGPFARDVLNMAIDLGKSHLRRPSRR